MRCICYNLCSLLLLCVLSLLLNPYSEAQQNPQVFRVVIAGNVNLHSDIKETLDITTEVTEAIYREFTNPVKSKIPLKFEVIGTPDISAAAERLGIATRTEEDYFRIAKELRADLLLKSESAGYLTKRKREPIAGVQITIQDVSLRIRVGLGLGVQTAKKMPQAIERAVKTAVRFSLDRFGVTADVLAVIGESVTLDRGRNNDVRVGDKFVIFRESGRQRAKLGTVGVAKAFASDAEAELLEGGGLRMGDKAIRIADNRFTCFMPVDN